MATIKPFIANNATVGQDLTVKTKKFVWISVGNGTVATLTDYEIGVEGTINVVIYNGPLNIHLKLTDEDPTATTGPCILQLNSYTDENATYQTNGSKLTVAAVLGGQKQNITITPCDGGTQTECKLFGKVNETVHLEPA